MKSPKERQYLSLTRKHLIELCIQNRTFKMCDCQTLNEVIKYARKTKTKAAYRTTIGIFNYCVPLFYNLDKTKAAEEFAKTTINQLNEEMKLARGK